MSLDVKKRIKSDIKEFSRFHMWYKVLPYEGRDFLMFPYNGKQPKNTFVEREEIEEIHWWFLEIEYADELPISGSAKEFVITHPVTFNCFLRGVEGDPEHEMVKGIVDIEQNNPGLVKQLREKYPEVRKEARQGGRDEFTRYVIREYAEQVKLAEKTGRAMYKFMKKKCPASVGVNSSETASETSESSSVDARQKTITRKRSFIKISPPGRKKKLKFLKSPVGKKKEKKK